MASIAFVPAKYSSDPNSVVQHSDFEQGFSVTQNGNVFEFTGQWTCPAPFKTNTQTLVNLSSTNKTCAVVSAVFSCSGGIGKITGSLTVTETSTAFEDAGISDAVKNATHPVTIAVGDGGINAPFLMGGLDMANF